MLQDTWELGSCLSLALQSSRKHPWLLVGDSVPPCALSLQPLQAAGPLGAPAAMCSVSGRGSSRGAVPTAVLHPLGFGICDCPNYLLQ